MKLLRFLSWCWLAFGFYGYADSQPAVTLENDFVRITIGADGQNLQIQDKQSGKDFRDPSADPAFAHAKIKGKEQKADVVSFASNRIHLQFGNTGVKAVLAVTNYNHYFTLKVVEVQGENIESLTFIDLSLILDHPQQPTFTGCSLALNLQTNVPEMPGVNQRIRAICYPRFGLVGAEMALVACPLPQMRTVLQEAVSQAKDIPHSTLGGPWAMDAKINKGSYLFNFGDMSEQTVDQWIALAKQIGFTQIDFHGGNSFRFGDCRPNPETYPQGRASFKAVIDRLHAAGISAGLHTYAFFIDKKCPWVTPVPDPRLGKDASFTLALELSTDADLVPVVESTQAMSTTTGFFVRNSVTLQIDNELITYSGINKSAPYAFTQCKRGAYGTQAAAHSAGAKVHHLKECFGYFTPDGDSTLLAEVAAKTAEMFNECGFDMMYLDALDGEDILGGAENGWHYGSKYVFEIVSRLHKSALMEMSTFHHHLWYVRSRFGAWDHPTRGHKRFIDIHCQENATLRRMFLPGHLGWWAIKTWSGVQGEPTFADDIEYLCGKCIGNDVGFSIMGIDPNNVSKPVIQRLAGIMQRYENLRHSDDLNESVKAQLRIPGKEFTLAPASDGRYRFHPAQYLKHKVEGSNPETNRWEVENPYPTQPLQLRIEALMSAQPYEATDTITVVDFSNDQVLSEHTSADGVSFALRSTAQKIKNSEFCGVFTADNSSRKDPKSAWVKAGKTYTAPLNLKDKEALGVWVEGDGNGEILNFQLRSPEHITSGIADHYIPIDFTGWRYFELIESESDRYGEYHWPYGNIYSMYRENVDYSHIESFSLWYNNLPTGKPVRCRISPIKALPLVSVQIKNPAITIAGKKLIFPIALESGQYLEFRSLMDCKLYGKNGELLQEIQPQGEIPNLSNGINRILFSYDENKDVNVRARVTLISRGEAL